METAPVNSSLAGKICLVIPCYNEAARLDAAAFEAYIAADKNALLCFVDDGSKDNTFQVLQSVRNNFPEQVSVIKLNKNAGKAEAVRTGFLHALQDNSISYIGYFDADLSAPLQESYHLKKIFDQNPDVQLAFGSRIVKIGSTIERKLHRHLLGRVVATAISLLLGLMIYDTQCGAKLFKRELAQQLFKQAFVTRWLFDVEIFSRIINYFGKEKTLTLILEVPLNKWTHKDGSKITAAYSLRLFWDLYRIRKASKKLS